MTSPGDDGEATSAGGNLPAVPEGPPIAPTTEQPPGWAASSSRPSTVARSLSSTRRSSGAGGGGGDSSGTTRRASGGGGSTGVLFNPTPQALSTTTRATFLTDVGLLQYRTLRAPRVQGPDDIVVSNPSERRPLPPSIHLPAINDAILKGAPFAQDPADQRFWGGEIASAEYQAILADAYWFSLSHVVQKRAAEKVNREDGLLHLDRSPHFSRISRAYVEVLKRVPEQRIEGYKQKFEEVLAYALILCYQAAFPGHVETFRNVAFVHKMMDLCAEWVRGFRPTRNRFSSKRNGAWIVTSSLGIAEGVKANHVARKEGPPIRPSTSSHHHSSSSGKEMPHFLQALGRHTANSKVRPRYTPLILRRVRYKLQHSPLIDRYLSSQYEKDRPNLGCCMTWTEEPSAPLRTMVSNLKEVPHIKLRHPATYRSVPNVREEVRTSLATRRSLCEEYTKNQRKYRQDLGQIRRGRFTYTSERPMTREMEALAASGDIHELSNCLVNNIRAGTAAGRL